MSRCILRLFVSFACLVAFAASASAQTEQTRTIWQALGIPQASTAAYDAFANRRGNRPSAERGERLRRIADPVNLESDNEILRRTAEIKQNEDLAQQKIKAVKYIASIGCGCHDGADEVLVAALEDCTEVVRYEAALAIIENASRQCGLCDHQSCCSKKIVEKLAERAYGRDERYGCWIEPSPRVRAAAEYALLLCCPSCCSPLIEEYEEEDDRGPDERDALPNGSPADPSATSTGQISPVSLRLWDPPPSFPGYLGDRGPVSARLTDSTSLAATRRSPSAGRQSRPRRVAARIEGTVTGVNHQTGEFTVCYQEDFTAVVGGESRVSRGFLLGEFEAARLRVVEAFPGYAICQRLDGGGRVREGDTLMLLGYRMISAD
jgi:hypothetical protein